MPKNSSKSGFRYRDSKTGRLVSKAKWKRSKAQGGKRYKRETVKPRKPRKKQIDPAAAIKKVLDELNLPLGGPYNGKEHLYNVHGDFSGPPEYLVSIRITGEEGDQKIIRKRIKPREDSDIIEFDDAHPWETEGKTD